jgi:hypothetical protein
LTLPAVSPDPDDSATLNFVRDLYSDARSEKRKLKTNWDRYYRLLRNQSWSEFRPQWMPSPSSAELYPGYATLVAWMTDQAPSFMVAPEVPKNTQVPQEALEQKSKDMKSVLHARWVTGDFQTQQEMMVLDALTFGGGIAKTGFDPASDSGKGDVTYSRIDPYSVYPDPHGSNEDDIRYLIEARDASLYEIRQRFPERGHLVEGEARTDSDSRPRIQGLEIVPQTNLSATGVTGDWPGTASPGMPPRFGPTPGTRTEDYTETARLLECWVKATKRVTSIIGGQRADIDIPYWQFVAIAGNVVLTEDTSNPFSHGGLPYIRFPLAHTGEWWSIAMTEQILPALIALNRLLASLQINAELTGNPILLEDERAGTQRTKVINRPGSRITKSPGSEVRWLDPPRAGPDIFSLIAYYREAIDRALGISAVARGEAFRRREAAASVDAVQEASFVRIRSIVRSMERALSRATDQIASNVVQFFTEPRNIAQVGLQGELDMLALGARHFQLPQMNLETQELESYVPIDFKVYVEAGSSLPTSRLAKAAEGDSLYQMGALDLLTLLEEFHQVPNAKHIAQTVQQQSLQAAFTAAAQKGQR